MQSSRTSKQSSEEFINDRNITLHMQLENILLKLFKSAQNLLNEECLQRLTEIIQQSAKTQQDCVKSIQSALFLLLSQIQVLTQKTTIQVNRRDYEVLEESLQKSESEVRKHIRIQQQLKLYLDGLEQKNDQLQKQLKIQQIKYHQLFQSVKAIDGEKKDLLKKIKKMQERNKFFIQKQKIKNHKSVKLISESFTRQDHSSMSMYKSRQTLTQHQHSKSKISDKSSQKDKKELRIVIEKNPNKTKQLEGFIDVNLETNPHRQSRESYQNDESFIPTEEDVRLFREMTKTVQMKEAYKRPVRKVTKYKTENRDGKQMKETKHHVPQPENREYRSVSMYK